MLGGQHIGVSVHGIPGKILTDVILHSGYMNEVLIDRLKWLGQIFRSRGQVGLSLVLDLPENSRTTPDLSPKK